MAAHFNRSVFLSCLFYLFKVSILVFLLLILIITVFMKHDMELNAGSGLTYVTYKVVLPPGTLFQLSDTVSCSSQNAEPEA